MAWFNENLSHPPAESFQNGKGLSWFRREADECIGKMCALVGIYQDAGARILVFVHPEPGKITYQDEFQVVAVPGPTLRFRPAGEVVS